MSSLPSPFRSVSVGDPAKPRFTWFCLVSSAGWEKAGSIRTGKPATGVPSSCQA